MNPSILPLLAALACAQAAPVPSPTPDLLNVRDFGALGDGKADDTAAFQRALDAAGQAGGGVVHAPRGNYRFTGRLSVPSAVTLQGVWVSVPAHNGMRDRGLPRPTDDGTTFLVTADAGKEDAPAFLTLNTNSTLRGVVVYYPDQPVDDVPRPYPWAIAMRGKNPAVLDVELLNPYRGIDASQNERHLVRNVSGQPLRLGVFVDAITDVGRIENVHFNPWWSIRPKLLAWQMEHGEAFVLGRTDWQYVVNTFCFGYHVGYRFTATENGVCNGNFLGIGADDCQTALVVEQSAQFGLLITNGEFVSFHGPDPTMVEVTAGHTGSVRFSNCAFWGPCNQVAKVAGRGTVGFSDCTFVQWDRQREGRPALRIDSGTVLVRGCEFREAKTQIRLGEGVRRAVVTGNVFTGPARVENQSKGSVKIAENAEGEAK